MLSHLSLLGGGGAGGCLERALRPLQSTWPGRGGRLLDLRYGCAVFQFRRCLSSNRSDGAGAEGVGARSNPRRRSWRPRFIALAICGTRNRSDVALPRRIRFGGGRLHNKRATRRVIEETMRVLGTDADEVTVERAKRLRNNVGPRWAAFVVQFNGYAGARS